MVASSQSIQHMGEAPQPEASLGWLRNGVTPHRTDMLVYIKEVLVVHMKFRFRGAKITAAQASYVDPGA